MVINTIDTRIQRLEDLEIVTSSNGVEAIFYSTDKNSLEGFITVRANYPNNFHPSDEFRDKVKNELSSKYKRYLNTSNIYNLQNDLDDIISSEVDGFEEDEYGFEEED